MLQTNDHGAQLTSRVKCLHDWTYLEEIELLREKSHALRGIEQAEKRRVCRSDDVETAYDVDTSLHSIRRTVRGGIGIAAFVIQRQAKLDEVIQIEIDRRVCDAVEAADAK